MATLTYKNTKTVNNTTITLGGVDTRILEKDTLGTGTTLTFGSNTIINSSGTDDEITSTTYPGDAVVNKGTINANGSGGTLTIDPEKFTNAGSINVSSGDSLVIQGGASFANAAGGTIAIGADSSAYIGNGSMPWTNTGSITVGTDAELHLGGSFSGSAANHVTNSGGTVFIDGTLNGMGSTLHVGAGGNLGEVALDDGGTIKGATIKDSGSGMQFDGGTLSGVKYDGTLDLSADGATVDVANGITLKNFAGTGNGTVNLTGDGAVLDAQGSELLNNATINIGSNTGNSQLLNDDAGGPAATLALGPNLTINQTGLTAELGGSLNAGDTIVNNGTINAGVAGGTLLIDPENFTNNGTISATNGDTVDLQPAGSFTNLAGGALTGGTYVVGAGSTIELNPDQSVATLNADVTLGGAGSTIESYATGLGSEVKLDDGLTNIGASGELRVIGGRDFVDGNAVTIDGTLDLGGGTFQAAGITVDGSGLVTGNGTLSDLVNNGLIQAAGGTLDVAGPVTGTGSFTVADHSTLELGGATSEQVNLAGTDATLQLDDPTSFTGTIAGFQSADAIDLVNQDAVAVTVSGTTLNVTLNGGAVEHFTLAAPAPGFTTVSDGHGGTDIVICFMPGTAIATPDGERAIEALGIGDTVTTHDGNAAKVMWIGRQTVSIVFGNPLKVLPVRIKAHALGQNLPKRDLLVSPDHALLVDDVLVQAAALVNGRTITREHDVPEVFTYYHVELADHALILAENVPAETFVDNVDRMAFDNWAEHQALYPDGCAIGEMAYPRAKSARQVPMSIRRRLDGVAVRLNPADDAIAA